MKIENQVTNVPEGGTPVATAPVAPTPAPTTQPSQPVAPVATPVVSDVQQVAQQVVQPVPATPAAQPSFELPQGVSQRTTEEFQKLTESNRRLLEANQILENERIVRGRTESQFAPIQQPAVVQQPSVEEFVGVDPITGEQYVDNTKLQAALDRANNRAIQAEQQIKNYIDVQQKKETEKQETETYASFPQLNPNNVQGFDSELSKLTRAYALDSMMNPVDYGNRTLTFKEAADLANKKLNGNQSVVTPSPEAQQISAQQPVEQNTNVQPTITPTNGQPVTPSIQEQGGVAAEGGAVNVNPASISDDSLVLADQTRHGDMWALAKRLTTIPHTGTPTHSEGE